MGFLVDTYLRYATGINWRLTLYTLSFTREMNYVRLAIGWGLLLCMVLLFAVTLFYFRKTHFKLIGKTRTLYVAGWALLAFIRAGILLWGNRSIPGFLSMGIDWVPLGLFMALMVVTLGLVRQRKADRATQ